MQRLCTTRFLRATNAESGQTAYVRPTDAYVPSEGLMLYFQGNPTAWFLAPAYDALVGELDELGVSREVRVEGRQANSQGHVILRKEHSHHVRGLRGFDPACMIDGLDHALDTITLAKATYLWNNVLRPHQNLIRGIVESASHQTYQNSTRSEQWSSMGEWVTSRSWLPTESGAFVRPSELAADDLPADFAPDSALAEALGLRQTPLKTLSQETGYSVAELAYLLRHRDQIAGYIKAQEQEKAKNTADDDDEPDIVVNHDDESDPTVVDFGAGLAEVFVRPSRGAILGSDVHEAELVGPVTNPEKRLEKTKRDIAQERLKDPREPRFARVPRRIWGTRDSAARTFLREQYHGHCQICGDTFLLRDGTSYFEGLTLVSRREGEWLDRPGNVLCLCATCCAKMQYGPIDAGDILEQINAIPVATLDDTTPTLLIHLCGAETRIRFSQRHWIDLWALLDEPPKHMIISSARFYARITLNRPCQISGDLLSATSRTDEDNRHP